MIMVKNKIKNENRKRLTAQKLINKEVNFYDLEDEEIEEMAEYFIQDINKIDEELIRIKKHIKKMRQELNN